MHYKWKTHPVTFKNSYFGLVCALLQPVLKDKQATQHHSTYPWGRTFLLATFSPHQWITWTVNESFSHVVHLPSKPWLGGKGKNMLQMPRSKFSGGRSQAVSNSWATAIFQSQCDTASSHPLWREYFCLHTVYNNSPLFPAEAWLKKST